MRLLDAEDGVACCEDEAGDVAGAGDGKAWAGEDLIAGLSRGWWWWFWRWCWRGGGCGRLFYGGDLAGEEGVKAGFGGGFAGGGLG